MSIVFILKASAVIFSAFVIAFFLGLLAGYVLKWLHKQELNKLKNAVTQKAQKDFVDMILYYITTTKYWSLFGCDEWRIK